MDCQVTFFHLRRAFIFLKICRQKINDIAFLLYCSQFGQKAANQNNVGKQLIFRSYKFIFHFQIYRLLLWENWLCQRFELPQMILQSYSPQRQILGRPLRRLNSGFQNSKLNPVQWHQGQSAQTTKLSSWCLPNKSKHLITNT